jgi:hypothetical protein
VDHIEDAVVALGVCPVVGLVEGDDQHPRFLLRKIVQGELKCEGVVARFVPRGRGNMLELAEGRRRWRVLVAGIDRDRARGVFGDVVKMIPTGEESDLLFLEFEFGLEKLEDGFVGCWTSIFPVMTSSEARPVRISE